MKAVSEITNTSFYWVYRMPVSEFFTYVIFSKRYNAELVERSSIKM